MDDAKWKGDSGSAGIPRFGRKARAWMARVLDRKLRELAPGWNDDEVMADLVAWYMDDAERYVKWVDDEGGYRGRGYSNGLWVIDWETVREDLHQGTTTLNSHAARERDTARFQTLDEWLRADLQGELDYPGALGGMEDVPDEIRVRVQRAAIERRRRWPIRCACGKSFVPDRRKARRCPDCRAANRAHVVAARRQLDARWQEEQRREADAPLTLRRGRK